MSQLTRLAILFFGQGLNFLIAITNIRAASKGYILTTGISDFLFCLVNFVLIQRIASAGSGLEILAYALGGMVGSMAAVYLTKHWKDS